MRCELAWFERIGPVFILEFFNKKFGLCFCHRRPDRSIWCFGLENYLCARCMGILSGGIIGWGLSTLGYPVPIVLSSLLLVPLIIDGFVQVLDIRESTNGRRFVTGLLFGIGIYFWGFYIATFV